MPLQTDAVAAVAVEPVAVAEVVVAEVVVAEVAVTEATAAGTTIHQHATRHTMTIIVATAAKKGTLPALAR